MSPTPEVVDELRQSSAAFSPPKKPFGPFIPQRLTIAFETINGCESISYMHCRRFALKSTHKIDQIQLPFIVTWHRGCLPFEPCLGTRSVSKLRDAVGRREIGSRSITVSSRRCCETPVTAHRRLQATGPSPGSPTRPRASQARPRNREQPTRYPIIGRAQERSEEDPGSLVRPDRTHDEHAVPRRGAAPRRGLEYDGWPGGRG